MSEPEWKGHVLVVDDEEDLCELLSMRLEHHGFRATIETTGRGALEVLEREIVDAMILDLRLDGEDGLDVLDAVQRRSLDLPVIVLTAHGTVETAVAALHRGAYGFLTKPFHDHELLSEVEHAVERVRLRREVAGLRRIVGDEGEGVRLLGTSARIEEVRERIARIARSDATVLLLGESGTGKELAARMLHSLSPRAHGRFVAINCGALPADLLESELFGHVRGAFTGAVRDKEGLFAAASGGTLLLDEVGDAPPQVQVKLLRVLQEREVVAVGATRATPVDVRVVAATHRDLRAAVERGTFREDLFYRLHVVPVEMPALRDRREDIPLLAELFLARAASRHRLSEPHLTSDALRILRAHDWPGNVRELANVIEGAALLAPDGVLRPQHVLAVLARAPELDASESEPPSGSIDGRDLARSRELLPLREAREAFDRAYLEEALRRAGGNVSAAARLAGRNRTDFHALLKRHGLSPGDFREG
ncbi:sigma-54-dependent transcriptional regulator [Sandaracinus amylolyticus]|uniref:Response regulator of zinc sigma-54-dependent two-component system n=1 Tax=Sandaracinus amylolyticus TaxID=927083 RepID=A0A0F6WAF8_9BACT|nr:sigma-54 dependent transcriptional regulator [Sandaracinus amylolyticus]AKF11536.1 Response regulator of zinc sigma-54-dependent two-component system [Sandaracinus amylolyticus]